MSHVDETGDRDHDPRDLRARGPDAFSQLVNERDELGDRGFGWLTSDVEPSMHAVYVSTGEVPRQTGDVLDVDLQADRRVAAPVKLERSRGSADRAGADPNFTDQPRVDELAYQTRDGRLVQPCGRGDRSPRSQRLRAQLSQHEREVVEPDRSLIGGAVPAPRAALQARLTTTRPEGKTPV